MDATKAGYNAITFPIKGPAGGSVALELQILTSCSGTAYTSYFYTVPTKMTGSTITVTVPLSSFKGANLSTIGAIVFESFTSGAWEIGQTQLACGSAKSTTTTSSTLIKSTTKSTTTTSSTPIKSTTAAASSGSCSSLLIDDFASQSRLTFLFYNAMMQPSSDDGTMLPLVNHRPDASTSVIVANNHVTLTPAATWSYFYTMLGCLKATNKYGGFGLPISAPAGTVMTIELQTNKDCSSTNPVLNDVSSTDLGWTFDGTEKFYTIPFSKFPGLDTDHLVSLLFAGFTKPVTLGPIAAYCGTTAVQYHVPTVPAVVEPSSTVTATIGNNAFVIDSFPNANINSLGLLFPPSWLMTTNT
jgi:hypothetical protein